MKAAIEGIEAELVERLAWFEEKDKLLEAQRLRMRTTLRPRDDARDRRLLRHRELLAPPRRSRRGPDAVHAARLLPRRLPVRARREARQTVPQLHGQYEGDRSRKDTLVEHGFRLPSAMDNRPLRFEEFVEKVNQVVFMSATPSAVRARASRSQVVEQIVRPTGLIDPEVVVKPDQGPDRRPGAEINVRAETDQRVLVTTLTKKMSEDLTDYLLELGIRVRYLHSEVDTLERVELLRVAAPRRVRRARRHQPAAGGPRPARGVAGRDPRRGQGGLPPLRDQPDPDDRPRRAQRRGPGDHVRGPGDRLDAARDQRDEPAAQEAARLQRGARHRPADDPQEGHRHPGDGARLATATRVRQPRSRAGAEPAAAAAVFDLCRRAARGARPAHPDPPGGDARGREGHAVRGGGAAARRDQRAEARADRGALGPDTGSQITLAQRTARTNIRVGIRAGGSRAPWRRAVAATRTRRNRRGPREPATRSGAGAQPPQRRPRPAARPGWSCFTGLSGSGKSSLAFDTIYAEGQRRYVESLSSYARQFLGPDGQARRRLHRGPVAGDLDRPEVGVAQPALDRRHDHRDLRLPAAALRAHRDPALPEVRPGHHPPDPAADRRPRAAARRRARASRCWRRSCGAARASTRACSPSWPSRASPGPGSTASSSSCGAATSERLARYENHTIEVVVDRLVRRPGIERRLTDSLETALRLAEGVAEVEIVPRDDDPASSRRSRSRSTSRARTTACRSTSSRRATSRSTRRTARASAATASARASRSTPS